MEVLVIHFRTFVALWLMTTLAVILTANADEDAFWRYSGGRPTFVGGGLCPLKKDEPVKVLSRRGYDLCYAKRLKSCLWVAYALTPSDVSNQVGRVGTFKKDDDALRIFVPAPGDFLSTGYDRGHMAPSQDMQYNERVSRESFYMGNMMPQTPRLNRGEWKRFETKTHRRVVPQAGIISASRVYVMTGPVFTKQAIAQFEREQREFAKTKSGRPPILKPEAFWKIVKCGADVDAVIMDQKGGVRSVSVQEISEKTGLLFFGGLNAGLRKHYLSRVRHLYQSESRKKENTENEKHETGYWAGVRRFLRRMCPW